MKKLILAALIIAGLTCTAQQKTTEKETIVTIKTSMGTIKAKLYNDTPKHRDNFIKLVNEGWYNGSPFHRVIKDFMIQGGQNADGRLDPGYTIPAEIMSNHFHKKGALAAARMPDQVNPKKASSGSQFYIVQGKKFDENWLDMYESRTGKVFSARQRQAYQTTGGSPHLDGDYTVFGEVIEGLDVVDKIAAVKTGAQDVPVEPVTIISVTIEKGAEKACGKNCENKSGKKSCCQ
jgi:cyclophilin family peptidyl-prolyl cis-trans isomerase